MDKILNFLADNYQMFALASVVVLFALIGFLATAKKKKKEEVKLEDAQPISMDDNAPKPQEVSAPVSNEAIEFNPSISAPEQNYAEPSLEGFESNITHEAQPEVQQTLVIEDNNQTTNDTMLVIGDNANVAPSLPTENNIAQEQAQTLETISDNNPQAQTIEFMTPAPAQEAPVTSEVNLNQTPQVQTPSADLNQPQQPVEMLVINDSASSAPEPPVNNMNNQNL